MVVEDLLHKSCLIGLSYFDTDGNPLKQNQLCGVVIEADPEHGIAVKLNTAGGSSSDAAQAEDKSDAVFRLPPNLSAWFVAPPGHYRNAECGIDIKNPDFLVTWDIYRTKRDGAEGQHEWWEWVPRTAPPQVNS